MIFIKNNFFLCFLLVWTLWKYFFNIQDFRGFQVASKRVSSITRCLWSLTTFLLPWWVRIKSPMWQNLKNFQKFLSYDHNSISFGKTKARAFFWMFSHWFWTIFHHFTTFWKKSLFWIYDSLAIWVKLEMRMSKT